MDANLEALASYILEGLMKQTLSDAIVNEFTMQGFQCIQNETEICWDGSVGKLREYLMSGRTALSYAETDVCNAFRQGRLYAVMELLKITQEQCVSKSVLEQDAKYYSTGDKRRVFEALKGGKSLTHGELANACKFSDSSLSQFMHNIEPKNYIHSRKVGRTKYYRLSNRGQKLLDYIPSRHSRTILASQLSNNLLFHPAAPYVKEKKFGEESLLIYNTQQVTVYHPDKLTVKQLKKTTENGYMTSLA